MFKLHTSADPDFFGWVFAEKEKGQRITRDMVTIDTNREDVHVNKYGVLLFWNAELARDLLKDLKA